MKLCAYMTEQYLKSAYPDVCISPEDREVLHRFIKCQLFGLCIDWMLGGMKQDVGEQMARVLELYRGVAELILETAARPARRPDTCPIFRQMKPDVCLSDTRFLLSMAGNRALWYTLV